MILEIAEIKIKPGAEDEFVRNVATGVAIFKRAKGCQGMELKQSPEAPGEYRLLVRWQTLENHTVDFRGSADFLEWRKLTAHCFAEPPVIKNWSGAVDGFGFS
jgi:heme-degrading monooxygenase HmoA